MIGVLTFVIGLIIGSFLNVCIYRIPRNESIVYPASHCTECGYKLAWCDLIPLVSYLFLRGRCRSCGTKISLRYPLIELVTGIVFLLLFIKYGLTLAFLLYAVLMSVLIVVFFIDLDHMVILNKLVIFALVAAIIVALGNLFTPLTIYGDNKWWNPFLGALLGSGFLFVVAVLGSIVFKSDEAMGGGDIKLMLPIGLFLGWRLTILTLFLSVIIAGVVGIVLLALKITSRKSSIPFGPFIVIGCFISIMYGYHIINWYLGIY